MVRKGLLSRNCSGRCAIRRTEDDKERVALRAELVTSMRPKGIAQKAPVLVE
jgi:hypothetical protein